MNIPLEEFDRRVYERVQREKRRQQEKREAKARARKRRAALLLVCEVVIGLVAGCAWNTIEHRCEAKEAVELYLRDKELYGQSAVEVEEWAWEWLRCE